MYIFTLLLFIIIAFSILGLIEFSLHQKRLNRIPIRIHVNGTRGKSSVTRLIGAGLRAGGIKTITKVSGTYPRMILDDGSEVKIHRKAEANIIEQLSIVKYAAKENAGAIVVECMALQPQYQWITEKQMIKATTGVITNVRLDHVDVMGHTLPEIAKTLGETIPNGQHFFMGENGTDDILKKIALKKKAEVHVASKESVSKEEMAGFNYIEHRENVSMALAVCEHLGITHNKALEGMYKAIPDAGVLRHFKVDAFGKVVHFLNAFAANDPQSTLMIWNMIKTEIGFAGTKIILLNTRQDRLDRAKQLAEMLGKSLQNETDYLILIGQSTDVVKSLLLSEGVDRNKIINLGLVKSGSIFEEVLSHSKNESTVFAIGNIGGIGGQVADFFERRSTNLG